VNKNFNILKVSGSINVRMLIIEEMWKKITDSFQYECGVKIVTCDLVNNGKCKL
jgi:hypothetical protein